MAILSILSKIATTAKTTMGTVGKTVKASKPLKVVKSVGSGTKKVIDIIFNNTTMFLIIFGYLIYSITTGGTHLFDSCMSPAIVGGGILSFFFGGLAMYITVGACIAYKVLVEPFNTVYYRFISVEHLSTRGLDVYENVVERVRTLEPYLQLIAIGAYIFFIIAVFKKDKKWMYRAGKVLLIMILIGMATNAGIYFYDILFSFRDWLVNLISFVWS